MTEKLDMTTPDMVAQNIERIAALFPHCIVETECIPSAGSVQTQGIASPKKKIDFDILRQELSRDIVEGPKERYRLEWPGKREATDEKSEAYKAGYKNICEIGKERIRRAGAKIVETQCIASQNAQDKGASLFDNVETPCMASLPDIGFRVYRLDTSNMQDVYYRPQDYTQQTIDAFANHIKSDRTPDDLVAQVMLDWGLPLSLSIERTTISGKTVYKVDGNALYCCFDEGIDEAFARAMAPEKPMRIVFHDHSFASDTAKENVRQLLKQLSGETEMKVV